MKRMTPLVVTSALFSIPAVFGFVHGQHINAFAAGTLCAFSIANHAKLAPAEFCTLVHTVDTFVAHVVCCWYMVGSVYGFLFTQNAYQWCFLVSLVFGAAAALTYKSNKKKKDNPSSYYKRHMLVHGFTCIAWMFYISGYS